LIDPVLAINSLALALSPDEIREIQLVLIERGFVLEADGRLAPRTRQALIQFRQRAGLQVTGQIDSRTVAALGVTIRSGPQGQPGQPSTTGQGGGQQAADAFRPEAFRTGARRPAGW